MPTGYHVKYINYLKSYSALRRILNTDNSMERQFAVQDWHQGRRGNRVAKLIWNANTDNVVAMVNPAGTVFVRPNSVYANHLLSSTKKKVIVKKNLNEYRGHVSTPVRNNARINYMVETALDGLIEHDDAIGRVYLFSIESNTSLDIRSIIKNINLKVGDKLPNTKMSLDDISNIVIVQEHGTDKTKVYVDIKDFTETIRQQELEDAVREEIAIEFYENFTEIRENSILSARSINPLAFRAEHDGQHFEGYIYLNRFNWRIPDGRSPRQHVNITELKSAISFEPVTGDVPHRGSGYNNPSLLYGYSHLRDPFLYGTSPMSSHYDYLQLYNMYEED